MNRFPDILGPDFECRAEIPQDPCPATQMPGPVLDEDTGEHVCPYCRRVLNRATADETEFFDDDEDDSDLQEDGSVFVAEGDRVIEQTAEQGLIIARDDTLTKMAFALEAVDNEFAVYLVANKDTIIPTLRELELARDPAFTGRTLAPKLLAVASFELGRIPNDAGMIALQKEFTGLGKSVLLRRIDILRKVLRPDKDNSITSSIMYIGNALDIPSIIIDKAVEDYERLRPKNKIRGNQALAAAWLYIIATNANIKILKKDLFAVPGVPRNATNLAIKSYKDSTQKIKGENDSESKS